ncbi:BadF/BadG/BcrA/BcrD ATPase family protein [Nonomuraea sp. NPDC005692]|uniref:BadF/BadG/BcrA/BcrD ATPase family protein n=1 Tax=Nonomuraea sp. NPDC005692 TaxID=3157168 RepID=UPI003411330C
MSLVLGLDVGGTTTRALVADLDGTVLARASGEGGNPVAHGAAAVERVGATVCEALTGLDPGRVRAGVIGLAGGMGRYAADFDRLWARLGLGSVPRLISDVELAFAAGTDPAPGTGQRPGLAPALGTEQRPGLGPALGTGQRPAPGPVVGTEQRLGVGPEPASWPDSGSVLVCGTGAAACRITGGRTVRCADGHGWLLGDLGSGVWIGRQAIRHTLRAIDLAASTPLPPSASPPTSTALPPSAPLPTSTALPPSTSCTPSTSSASSTGLSPLAAAVLVQLTGGLVADRAVAGKVIEAVHAAPVAAMAALAPVVTHLALQDDPDAAGILARAAAHLLATLAAVREPGERTPLVLGGGLLAAGSPLAATVRRQAAARWPAAPISHAGDGALAAARLARHDLRKALR